MGTRTEFLGIFVRLLGAKVVRSCGGLIVSLVVSPFRPTSIISDHFVGGGIKGPEAVDRVSILGGYQAVTPLANTHLRINFASNFYLFST